MLELVKGHQFYDMQAGRYRVVLSLEEAEAVRGLIHCKTGRPVLETTAEALLGSSRNITGGGAVAGTQATGGQTTIALRAGETYLDLSTNHEPPRSYQQLTTDQCLRFLDSEIDYSEKELNVVLRALQVDGDQCFRRPPSSSSSPSPPFPPLTSTCLLLNLR